MYNCIQISKEMARQLAFDWYDIIVQDIKAKEAKGQAENLSMKSNMEEEVA